MSPSILHIPKKGLYKRPVQGTCTPQLWVSHHIFHAFNLQLATAIQFHGLNHITDHVDCTRVSHRTTCNGGCTVVVAAAIFDWSNGLKFLWFELLIVTNSCLELRSFLEAKFKIKKCLCFQAFHFRIFKNDLAKPNSLKLCMECIIPRENPFTSNVSNRQENPIFATKKPYCMVNIGIYPSQISFQISSLGRSTHVPGIARASTAKSRQLCEHPKLGTLEDQPSSQGPKTPQMWKVGCFLTGCVVSRFRSSLLLFVVSLNINWRISA